MGQVVHLTVEKLVKRYDRIIINCSSDSMPIVNTADVYVEKSFYNIRHHNGSCFSTALTSKCSPDVCQCSSQGLWYSHSINMTQPDGFIYIECSMVFGQKEVFSGRIKVRIVEFSSPRICPEADFPLDIGYLVTFSCKVESANHHVIFQWDCLNNESADTTIEESTRQSSTITRKIHLKHDKQTCICIANVDGYLATANIQISVNKKPDLETDASMVCNDSLSINISCTISTELSTYGFDMWEHSFRGILIRSLKGKEHDTRSILTIPSCSFQDAGDYRCYGWTTVNGEIFSANKSVSLYINGPPLIVSATQSHGQNVTLSVLFCSSSEPDPIWLHLDTPIKKSTQMTQILRNTSLPIQVYNATVMCAGYITNLTTHFDMADTFVVRLKNDFGEVRKTFLVDLKKTKGVVHVVGPHEMSTIPIYHSAPSAEPVIHVYDSANSGYLEVIDNASSQSHYSERDNKESEDGSSNTTSTAHDYEYID
ncbi:unnamed protein product [Mytilus coruscus]|uniref:Ig-like domain-containing protein n=1 Tax=Mytilus coruscus TaxID=42192 RepID=A0A6J8DN28_MYTCO|nr:unnamed protein product [Mytilus coruscus]